MRRTDDLETGVDRDDAAGGATIYWSGLCTWMCEPSSRRFPETIGRYRNEQDGEQALKVGDKYPCRRLVPHDKFDLGRLVWNVYVYIWMCIYM